MGFKGYEDDKQYKMKLDLVAEGVEKASAKGLADGLFYIAEQSQQKVPRDKGDLSGSLEVEVEEELIAIGDSNRGIYKFEDSIPDTVGDVVRGSVSYNTPYAAAQHEHTEYSHMNEHGYQNGEAKYLEKVIVNPETKRRILALVGGEVLNILQEVLGD